MNPQRTLNMLYEQLEIDNIIYSNAGDYLDTEISTKDVLEHLEERDPFGRRTFCEFLGIRESTLSGWLNEDRMPRSAKVAFGLLIAFMELKKKFSSYSQEVMRPIPVKTQEGWTLVQLSENEFDDVEGEVIAERISDKDHAVKLAQAVRALDMAYEVLGNLDTYVSEVSENKKFKAAVKEDADQIERMYQKAQGYEEWTRREKARRQKMQLEIEKLFGGISDHE
jgi:hypothetical protein